MLVIAETYRDLHLFQAAKYYAMAALYVAHRSTDDEVKVFVPRALASLVEAEYLNGEWGHFFCMRTSDSEHSASTRQA